MFLRKESNGFYYIYYEEFNRKRSISTKYKLYSDALKFLSEFKEKLQQREKEYIEPVPLTYFMIKFLDYYKIGRTRKSYLGVYYIIKEMVRVFGKDKIVCSITSKEIERYILEKRIKMKETSLGEFQARVNIIFNYAKDFCFIPKDFDFRKLKIKKVEKMPIFFTVEQFRILYSNLRNQPLKDISLMAFLTGMRQNELTTLKWNDVDIDRGLITLSNFGSITKTAKIRSIPLCTQAIELLKKDIYQGQMIMYLQPYLVKNG